VINYVLQFHPFVNDCFSADIPAIPYAPPVLRSPARRDEGWIRHAPCESLREAEVGKPKSNWELQELLGLTALIMDPWKGDNQYEKPGIHKKKSTLSFSAQLASRFRIYVPFFYCSAG